jgi:hypothetical protein
MGGRQPSLPSALYPDFNPIENAFAKLKALLRKAAERTVDSLRTAIGHIVHLVVQTNVETTSPPQDTMQRDRLSLSRYDAFRGAGKSLAIALGALLQKAPLPQLRGRLPPDAPRRAPSGRFTGMGLRELAAGIAASLLGAGVGAWIALSLAPGEGTKTGVERSENTRASIRTRPSALCTPTLRWRR